MNSSAAKILLFALSAMPAAAQQSVVDHCRNTSSAVDRIACLEAALLGRDFTVEGGPQAQIDPPNMESDSGAARGAIESAPVGIGAEQVNIQNQSIEEHEESLEKAMRLSVAGYHHVPYERLVVTLENGHVWRQIKGDTSRIRVSLDRNQTVDIIESGLGGYKLRLNEIRRTIRVERIR